MDDLWSCSGHIYANGRQECPQRNLCAKFRATSMSHVFVTGSDQIGNCTEFLAKDVKPERSDSHTRK